MNIIEETFRQRWGDIVALFLLALGTALIVWGHNELVQDTGKGFISTALFALRPGKMLSSNGNGNGNGSPSKPGSTFLEVTK